MKAALDITKTILYSAVDYGNIVLSVCTDGELSDLQTLRKNAFQYFHKIAPRDEHVNDLQVISNKQYVETRRETN